MIKIIGIIIIVVIISGTIFFFGHNKETSKDDIISTLSVGKLKTESFNLSVKAKKPQETSLKKNTTLSLLEAPKGGKKDVKKLNDPKKAMKVQDEIMGYRLKNKDRIIQIQTALRKAGFYSGSIDGKESKRVKKAIKKFQKAKGLVVDGIIGPKTRKELDEYLK